MSLLVAILALGGWFGFGISGPHEMLAAPEGTINLLQLLEATESREAAFRDLGSYQFPDPSAMGADLQPVWPIYSFLWAEIHRLRGDSGAARRIYQGLVEWSLKDSYHDNWGGSGLGIVSLWRWVELAATAPDVASQEKEHLLTIASELWKDQPLLARGMFQTLPYLPSLPQIKENLLRRLSSLAWSLKRKEAAQRFFIEYLSVATTGDLTPSEQELFADATSAGMLSLPKVALLLGARLEKLGKYEDASHWLMKARDTGKAQTRAEASLYLARLRRLQGEQCLTGKVKELLNTAIDESADPDVVQEGLFLRARIAIREGCPKNYPLFQKDLKQILKDFPRGRRADDALFQLAYYHLNLYRDRRDSGDLDAALNLFAQLRQDYPDRDAHLDSSWFKPAMALYTLGKPEDIRQAITYLQELEKTRPEGPLHLAALFWLGRMLEDSGEAQEARNYFATIIKEIPYDYYAIRARMHLHLGRRASTQLNPDAETTKELQAAYLEGKSLDLPLSGKSPYHLRLKAALQSGIYYRTLRSLIDLRNKEFPSERLENIPLEKLDEFHQLTHVALLLALRQDALAAIDTPPLPRNRLEVAKALSDFKAPDWPNGDWPLVIYISGAAGSNIEVKSQTQNAAGFLAIAYPKTFGPLISKFGQDFSISGALLYAIIRQESAFASTALSPAGALGLFQFTAPTFDELEKRWHLLKIRNKVSREEFLLNADDSIYLGARWFGKVLLPGQGFNLLWALMEHNAGYPAVNEWKKKWQRENRTDDYEFMIETARFGETSIFVRRVLTTYWIVQAAGLY